MRLNGFYIVVLLALLYVVGFIGLAIDGAHILDLTITLGVVLITSGIAVGFYFRKKQAIIAAFVMGVAILIVGIADGYFNVGTFLYFIAGYLALGTKDIT